MKKVRITVVRMACYNDLMEKYENPIEHACDLHEGQVFIADGWRKPEAVQDHYLGELRGKLFRRHNLNLIDFVERATWTLLPQRILLERYSK